MGDVIEVSYTGDLLAHRRCPRAWAYEKHVGFQPYEQMQAMEGRLVHHAMEWLTVCYKKNKRHARADECLAQLAHYFRVLWARGVRTRFERKIETLHRVITNLYPGGKPSNAVEVPGKNELDASAYANSSMHTTVKAVVEGAIHEEYEIRSIRQIVPAKNGGKSKLLLTGVLDLVVQAKSPLAYPRTWRWDDSDLRDGTVTTVATHAREGDVEIWDYKGSSAATQYKADYARQLLAYASIYTERTGQMPARCVLFFINEKTPDLQLLAIPVSPAIIDAAIDWTHTQVENLQESLALFRAGPDKFAGGEFDLRKKPVHERVTAELQQQCTACGQRFGCREYSEYLRARNPKGGVPADIDRCAVSKN